MHVIGIRCLSMKFDLILGNRNRFHSVCRNNTDWEENKKRKNMKIQHNAYSLVDNRIFHILFLLFSFLVVSNFFNIRFLSLGLVKIIHWAFDIFLIVYSLYVISQQKIRHAFIKSLWFIIYFVGVVTLSILVSRIVHNQNFVEGIRVSLIWYEYLFVFILFKMRITSEEVYKSIMIFSFIWMLCWIIGFCSPIVLFDASGGYNEDLVNTSRGVVRLKLSGEMILQLWGLWSLGLYIHNNRKRYLYYYLLCLLFTFLLVSRQHILFYSICGLFYWLYRSSWFKRVVILLLVVLLFHYVLPKIEIYNNLVSLTEQQAKDNKGDVMNDVRMQAADYYISEFNKSLTTIILGNGVFHFDSDYGKKALNLGITKSYWLGDIGYVEIYVYFGIIGYFFFIILGWFVYKIKIANSLVGLKIFICFVYFTNVFSHSFDISVLITSVILYLMCRENFIYIRMRRLSKYRLYLNSLSVH